MKKTETAGIDFIGDIHGHADELHALLKKLGYKNGTHPDGRIVVFLGDYLDRGPKIEDVLHTVHDMVHRGSIALMGNHELNAILFQIPDLQNGGYLRKHTEANLHQHAATLEQLGEGIEAWFDWIKALPLWFTREDCQAVHACWCPNSLAALNHARHLHQHDLNEIAKKESPLNKILKGLEIKLPNGHMWHDNTGVARENIRIKWWEDPANKTYSDLLMAASDEDAAPNMPLPEEHHSLFPGQPQVPTFVGHYWLKATKPTIINPKLACIDYSVAKGGFLCAYRFDGEQELNPEKFVYIA